MLIYTNGDSHTAGAEAVNLHAFAEDDGRYFYLGRAPHPDNARVAWPVKLADTIKSGVFNNAESASSNDRIIRTTKEWLNDQQDKVDDLLVVVQWSTWERQEWLIDGTYYQVNASGIDHVPASHQQTYKEFVVSVDWKKCTQESHDKIWAFHQELNDRGVKHIFFNGNSHFGSISENQRKDWGVSYLGPYDPKLTYNQWLLDNKYNTVAPNSYHFGKEAHAAWARFMLQYIVNNKMI